MGGLTLLLFFALIAIGTLVALRDWRKGLFWLVIVGLLQDPVRKVTPGVPGYLVLATTPIFFAIILKMSLVRTRWGRLADEYPRLDRIARLFVVSLIPAALVSATIGPGSWRFTILGAFMYGSLLLSVIVGYRFVRDIKQLRHFIGFYCVVCAVLLGGSLLEYFEVSFPALGTEMLGHTWTRQIPGVTVYMMSGFFRSPDVMGWHAAAVAMTALTLALSSRGPRRSFWIGLCVWGTSIAILCGRRKMVYMLPVFVIVLVWMFWWLGRRRNLTAMVAVTLVASIGLAFSYQRVAPDEAFMTYYTNDPRGVYASVQRHGFAAVWETYQQAGFFGVGLGTAAQGAHLLGVERPNVWQESGPSRALADLGVPGFICLNALAAVLLASLLKMLRQLRSASTEETSLWAGLFAMVIANAGSFVVSGQIFGDPFISTLLAILIGAILAAPRLGERWHGALSRRLSAGPPRPVRLPGESNAPLPTASGELT